MNVIQSRLPPTDNTDIGINDVGTTLRQLDTAASYDSNNFTQLMEMNTSLTRKLKEAHWKDTTLLEIVITFGGSTPPTHNTTMAE